MTEEIRNKIQEFKDKALFFKTNEIKAFIKDNNDSYYFCEIFLIEEPRLTVYNFAGQKSNTYSKLLWIDIKEFKEYEDKRILK